MTTLKIRKGKSEIFSQFHETAAEHHSKRNKSEKFELQSPHESIKEKKIKDCFLSSCLPTIETLAKKKFKTTFYRENNYKAYKVSTQRYLEKSIEKIRTDKQKNEPLLGIIALNKKGHLPPINPDKVKKPLKKVASNEVSLNTEKLTSSLTSPNMLLNSESDQRNLKSLLKFHQKSKSAKSFSADPYHVSNIVKSQNFTSFAVLLDYLVDFQVHPFPYFERAVKIKPNHQVKKKNLQTPKTPKKAKKGEKFPALLHIHRLRLIIPGLSRIHFHPKNIFRKMRIIIINLFDFDWLNLQDFRLWKDFKEIGKNFQFVFIIKNFSETFLEKCEENFHVSGVYFVNSKSEHRKDLGRCLDYSQIFLDFECKNLKEDVLVVTSHLLTEDLEGSLIFSKSYQPKIYAERIPVPSLEYPEGPLIFLLPIIEKYSYCLSLSKLCKYLQNQGLCNPEKTFLDLFDSEIFSKSEQSFYSVVLSRLNINWKQFTNFSLSTVVSFV